MAFDVASVWWVLVTVRRPDGRAVAQVALPLAEEEDFTSMMPLSKALEELLEYCLGAFLEQLGVAS